MKFQNMGPRQVGFLARQIIWLFTTSYLEMGTGNAVAENLLFSSAKQRTELHSCRQTLFDLATLTHWGHPVT
jgi:hypothetical protein